MDRLVSENWRLVELTVRKAHPRLCDSDREEVEAAGYLALVQAAQCFDPSKGAAFATHAIGRIRWATAGAALQCAAGAFAHRRMEKWSEVNGLPRQIPLDLPAPGRNGGETGQSIGELIPDGSRGTEQTVTDWEGQRYLWRVVEETLPARLGTVIRSHYAEGKTFRQIAEAEGVSHQAVSQWHKAALQTLRGRVPDSIAN